MSVLLELFTAFFRIGLFSFGGGYAIIPLLQEEAVSRGWMTAAEFIDVVAVSQVTPGPIAVNMATFVGFRQDGISGSLIATLGVCLPSLILVVAAMYFIAKVNNSRLLKGAFYGLRPAAAGLIGASAIHIVWGEFFPYAELPDVAGIAQGVSVFSIIVFAIAFVCIFKFKFNPIYVIIGAAVIGMVFG